MIKSVCNALLDAEEPQNCSVPPPAFSQAGGDEHWVDRGNDSASTSGRSDAFCMPVIIR